MTLLEHYEQERAEGRAEGLVEGRAEGLVEGRAEGIIMGAVVIMREDGKDDNTIIMRLIEKFGLSEDEARQFMDRVDSEKSEYATKL